jgi:hypothetical protein
MHTVLRWVPTVIVALLLVVPVLNVEKLAQEYHWDNLLVSMVRTMPDISTLYQNAYLAVFLGVMAGTAAFFWAARFAGREHGIIKTRPKWEAEQPLSEIFNGNNEIHALFLTGEGIFTRDPKYIRHVKRLLLPTTDASFLKLVEVSRKKSGIVLNLAKQINQSTQTAHQNGVEVRWLPDHIGTSILACNPEKPNGWMHIGFSTPFIDADKQPILRLDKVNTPELFALFYQAYNRLWDQGVKQKP